ncbi:MAG: YbhB/YbcL family Raf kinase inhibitor-like protein [Methanoregulaceae archaeon]|nr:YbhB/YbcL family Raf kinase inhibitor-like protein [Methanoregulaceae archaeon]
MNELKSLRIDLGFTEFPVRHTCAGENTSPRITIGGLDNETSLAVLAFNPFEKSCCSFSTWLIWNIPASSVIPEGIPNTQVVESPIRGVQGMNDYGKIGYSGPCAPHGAMIRYNIKVYGLDTFLDLPPGSIKHDLIGAMRGHVLAFGDTVAMWTAL